MVQVIPEGKYINGFLKYRFAKNKNAIIAVTGSTGSGKSMACLRMGEMWYQYRFGETFPEANICFNTQEVVDRLKDKSSIRKGDILILEEAGANLGSLDFQNKLSKLFTYILQSFRSMNVALIMNLPVLTMLNKQTRQLLHMHITTMGINFETKMCMLDAKIHQLNQHTGKSYWKHPRVQYNHKLVRLQNMSYGLPAQVLRDNYEIKKNYFVGKLVDEYEVKTTMSNDDIKLKEKEKIEHDKDMRRNEELKKYRTEDGKIRCVNCNKLKVNVTKTKITCLTCGHTQYLSL